MRRQFSSFLPVNQRQLLLTHSQCCFERLVNSVHPRRLPDCHAGEFPVPGSFQCQAVSSASQNVLPHRDLPYPQSPVNPPPRALSAGVIQPGRLTAVMGASGAGKTTFLNVLAGHASAAGAIAGSVTVNGEEVGAEKMRQISAFVHQVRRLIQDSPSSDGR